MERTKFICGYNCLDFRCWRKLIYSNFTFQGICICVYGNDSFVINLLTLVAKFLEFVRIRLEFQNVFAMKKITFLYFIGRKYGNSKRSRILFFFFLNNNLVARFICIYRLADKFVNIDNIIRTTRRFFH